MLDGWSVSRIFEEVRLSYTALQQGTRPLLAPPQPFSRYIAWLEQQSKEEANQYWQERLAGFKEPSLLPVQQRNALQPAYIKVQHSLDAETAVQLQLFCKQQKVTLNTLLQAVLGMVLARYCGRRDICFGVMISGRHVALSGIEDMVGLMINSLPCRLQVDPTRSVSDFLVQVQSQHQTDNRYGYSSLTEVQQNSELSKGEPLFDTLLAVENYPRSDNEDLEGKAFRIERMWSEHATNFPLTIMVDPGEAIDFYLLYDSNRLDDDTIRRFWGHLHTLLMACKDEPEVSLADLPMLTDQELAELQDWNAPEKGDIPDCTLLDLVEQQAAKTPENLALVYADERLTYQQLEEQANRLAHHILSLQRDSGEQPLTAIVLDRSP